ncbi:arabinogalactan protein 16-like [Aegilops tauschii subsp. strangulata]|uniref:Arabinogalactan peptide 16 n=1 Tax=Aegilops tauschii subsp. strangulata TaxID=200361 RepID=A0A453F5W0_AEGTS|nr:arabinogalactan protein 16-like [Aegilops tauschii subsp. strangulata]XP_044353329.1 arabinogalactan protein 16-like [Triticum aestivum]
MASISRASSLVAMAIVVVLASVANAQGPAPAPTASDGTSVDQGIAYVLMFVALALTYLIHPLDAASAYRLL